MQKVALGPSGQQTTRLGFGCSSLMGALGRKDSLAMLEAAFAAGIRHFDVAPSYGFGEAEACLGEFLARHAGQCTVTTKFGIPAEPRSWKSAVRGLARPVLKALPGLKEKLRGSASVASMAPIRNDYSVAAASASLDRSLLALQTERIDIWLLHEATVEDLTDDTLLRWIEDAHTAGKIGMYGVGSGQDRIGALLAGRPEYCPVLQYEWSVLDPLIPPGEPLRIHHRALTENFRSLHAALTEDQPRCRRWSEHVGRDLSSAETLAGLMLKASLVCNPESVILFSSKHPQHIRNNVSLADDSGAEEAALQLYALVRAEIVEVRA